MQELPRGRYRCPVKATGVPCRAGHWRLLWFLSHWLTLSPWPSNFFPKYCLTSWLCWPPQWLGWDDTEVSHLGNVLKDWGHCLVRYTFLCERNLWAKEFLLCAGYHSSVGRDGIGEMKLMLLPNFCVVLLNMFSLSCNFLLRSQAVLDICLCLCMAVYLLFVGGPNWDCPPPFSVSLVILSHTMFMDLNSNLFLSIIIEEEVCSGKTQGPTVIRKFFLPYGSVSPLV